MISHSGRSYFNPLANRRKPSQMWMWGTNIYNSLACCRCRIWKCIMFQMHIKEHIAGYSNLGTQVLASFDSDENPRCINKTYECLKEIGTNLPGTLSFRCVTWSFSPQLRVGLCCCALYVWTMCEMNKTVTSWLVPLWFHSVLVVSSL